MPFVLIVVVFTSAGSVFAEDISPEGVSEGLPPLIPREVLFGNPQKGYPQISPDGEMISYVAALNDVLNVWVKTIGMEDDRPVTIDTNQGVLFYGWRADSKGIIYVQDQEGNENYHLYGVDLKSGKIHDYTPFKDVGVKVVAWNKQHPTKLLISMNKRDPQVADIYKLNLKTDRIRMVEENPGNIAGWMADEDFKLRAAFVVNDVGGTDILVRDNERSDWRTLVSWNFEDDASSKPLMFSKNGEHLYLRDARDANAARLVKVDVNNGEVEVIAEDPKYDVGPAIFDNVTGEVLGVSFLKDRRVRVFFDEELEVDFEIMNQLAEGEIGVSDRDLNDKNWLITFSNDDGPSTIYVFDRDTKKGTYLFTPMPVLKKFTLAPMEPISFLSRDSLTIHGYVTFPVGLKRKKLPMVLLVHGGPWSRDYWGYNSEAQWLANRGYICLQVNFRGSTGYGKDFLNAGNKEWGRKMHYDLVDAVNWAVKEGYADPDRVAIYGASFGGYAALCGAAFSPDVFCCAIDAFGPSDLTSYLESIPPLWQTYLNIMYLRVGNPETEAEMLKERSPLHAVDNIKIPILVVQGANDPRVTQEQSDMIVKAMEKKGIDYQYMLFEDEGHGFLKEENRLEFYAAAEKFLAKHLGGRYQK